MQLLSRSPILAAAAAPTALAHFQELLRRPEFQEMQHVFLVQFVLGNLVTILAYWLASKAVAEPSRSTLPNALKLWLSYLLFWVVSIVGIFVVIGLMGVTVGLTRSGGLALTILGLAFLFFLFVGLFIPMNIYSIGIIRAFLMLLMALVIIIVGMIPVNIVLLRGTGAEKSVAALQRALTDARGNPEILLKNLAAQSGPDEIDRMLDEAEASNGRKPSLKEREAMVVTIQQKLATRQATLPPGNPTAQTTFQDQLNRYLRFRDSVIGEMKSQPGATR